LRPGRGLTIRRVIATADQILTVGTVLVLVLGVGGAVRPVRRAALYVLGATMVVLIGTWPATHADVADLHLQRASGG
jgi:hypothetical protein